jgi:hypothetical protein
MWRFVSPRTKAIGCLVLPGMNGLVQSGRICSGRSRLRPAANIECAQKVVTRLDVVIQIQLTVVGVEVLSRPERVDVFFIISKCEVVQNVQ